MTLKYFPPPWRSLLPVLCFPPLLHSAPELVPDEPVGFTQALRWAVENDPGLDALVFADEAAAGLIEQADTRPNPVVGMEIENLLGTEEFRGLHALEVTIGLSQTLETAGKRAKRVAVAERSRDLVEWDRQARLVAIATEVETAFAEVLLAQATLRLRLDERVLAQAKVEAVAEFVDAARSQQVTLTRARLEAHKALLAEQRAEHELDATCNRLAGLWGLAVAPRFVVVGELDATAPPELESLLARIPARAAMGRFGPLGEQREAEVALERARGRPDIDLFAGGRFTREGKDAVALVAGVEFPWPVFDHNQGNLRAALARRRAVEADRAVVERQLIREVSALHQTLRATAEEIAMIEAELLPAAEASVEATRAGIDSGQLSTLDLLDAREALLEIRAVHVDAQARHTTAQARLRSVLRPATLQFSER